MGKTRDITCDTSLADTAARWLIERESRFYLPTQSAPELDRLRLRSLAGAYDEAILVATARNLRIEPSSPGRDHLTQCWFGVLASRPTNKIHARRSRPGDPDPGRRMRSERV